MTHTHSTQATHTSADYILVVSDKEDFFAGFFQFAEKVNRKLKAGYQLHGPPFTLHQSLGQAMVRLEGPSASGDTTIFYQSPTATHPKNDPS